jgi:uncharacterized protein (TIGR02466 family)
MFHAERPNDIHLLYPTPLLVRQLPVEEAFNRSLRQIVLGRRESDRGVGETNVGGWQSRHDLFTWPEPECQQLVGWIGEGVHALMNEGADAQAAAGMQVVGWANVNGPGNYNKPHAHPGSMWSGVYYVEPGDRPEGDSSSGLIEFMDPRVAVDMMDLPGLRFSDRFTIVPTAGLLVLFPSWLVHYVNPYHGSAERISIAFNIRLMVRE